jgi:hypothetical protein
VRVEASNSLSTGVLCFYLLFILFVSIFLPFS